MTDHVTLDDEAPENDTWEAATLRSYLRKAGLSRAELARQVPIDRSVISHLVNAKRPLTPQMAARLAPHLGKNVRPSDLLEPKSDPDSPTPSPFEILQGLAKTVDDQQAEIEELQRRVETLENSGGSAQRATKASR